MLLFGCLLTGQLMDIHWVSRYNCNFIDFLDLYSGSLLYCETYFTRIQYIAQSADAKSTATE